MYQHNKVVYEELKDRLKTDTRVCVVQATGTGKGVIARTLIEGYESVIVVAPTQAILKNYQMNLKVKSDNVQYFTYQAISMMLAPQLDNLAKGVTLLILDEFHRIGAKTWGRKVEYLADKIENFNGKVVGLSATPVRYLDNERDMSIEFFNGNVVSGLNLVEAVVNGVLPTFKYVVSYYGYEKDLFKKMEERKDKLTDNIKALVANLENNYSIGKIIRQEIKDLGNNQKWIVFFSSVEELESFKDTVPIWFDKKVNVYTLHSYSNYKENMNILNDFNNADKGVNVLLSVNMLNEGVHLQGIDGVIMMRRTISPIVYLQQLGRALQVGGKEPIIFDFIGNYRRIGEYKEYAEIFNFVDEINNNLSNRKVKSLKEKRIIVHSYCKEIFEILSDLKVLFSGSWTESEIELIKSYAVHKDLDYLCKCLPYRTKAAIRQQVYYLGLFEQKIKWSSKDIEILKENYDNNNPNNMDILLGLLKDKTRQDIFYKASRLGLSNKLKRWTKEEEEILIKNYNSDKPNNMENIQKLLPEKSRQAIKGKAKKLGLAQQYNSWTDEEISILKKYYKVGDLSIVSEYLPHRTHTSITSMVRTLRLKGDSELTNCTTMKWSKEEMDILLSNWDETLETLCSLLPNRSCVSIEQKLSRMGKKIKSNFKSWKDDEIDILKKYYPKDGINVIHKLPNRSVSSIRSQVRRLGLTSDISCKSNPWTLEEIEILKKYYVIEGIYVVKRLPNRTKKAVDNKARAMGLTK